MAFLDDYTLLRHIGSGASAQIYKVRHNKLGYIRAIRVLEHTIVDEQDPIYIKFLQECKTLLRLGNGCHPNIVHIYQPLLRDNRALVEMDFIDGMTLDKFIEAKGGYVDTDEVGRMVRQMASALAYCHHDIYRYCMDREMDCLTADPDDAARVMMDEAKERELVRKYRVIHNDLHAANIMRGEYGYVLLDFGLALTEHDVQRSSMVRGGAPEYKAPEKFVASAAATKLNVDGGCSDGALTPQSDIYSFGIIVYQFLTGRVPFPYDKTCCEEEALYRLQQSHLHEEPPSIEAGRRAAYERARGPLGPSNRGEEAPRTEERGAAAYRRDYPEWLEELILRCLQKDPARRFADGAELYRFVKEHEGARACEDDWHAEVASDVVQVSAPAEGVGVVADFTTVWQNVTIETLDEDAPSTAPDARGTDIDVASPVASQRTQRGAGVWRKAAGAARKVALATLLTMVTLGSSYFLYWAFTVYNNRGPVGNALRTFHVNGVAFNLVGLDGGTYDMGVAGDRISPAHAVTVSGFLIGETEVTQELWDAVMDDNPSAHAGYSHPVENVSWEDCRTFIARLNELTGQSFRLPTEAEWEYACRGGEHADEQDGPYSGSSNCKEVAWYKSNSEGTHHAVGMLDHNAAGIYDMSGNVAEICNDFYAVYDTDEQYDPTGPEEGDKIIVRGGSFNNKSRECRSSFRCVLPPDSPSYTTGLRLAIAKRDVSWYNLFIDDLKMFVGLRV